LEDAGFSYSLHLVDLTVIILYLAASTLVGAMFRKGQKDIHTYFVGDREVSWWLVLVSIVATETSTVTFLSVPGLAFNPKGGNLTFLQLALGYLVGRILIAIVLLPGYFQGQYISAYEVLRNKFDARVQRSASFLFMLTRTIADGLRLFRPTPAAVHAMEHASFHTNHGNHYGGIHLSGWNAGGVMD